MSRDLPSPADPREPYEKIFTLKRSFLFFFIVLAVLSALMFFALQMISAAQAEIERASDSRYESYLLANEVRQNSQGLTSAVRSYVVTADPRYESSIGNH